MDKKQIISSIANNVRNLMNQRDVKTTELARRCQISTGTVSKIVNGNMSITVPLLVNLAEGLEVNIDDILGDIAIKKFQTVSKPVTATQKDLLSIGIISISSKRLTCIKDHRGKVVGTSELEGGLDLAETAPSLLQLIQESVVTALGSNSAKKTNLKFANLNLVMQSYEFEDTRRKFKFFTEKYFGKVRIMPDWQITYLATFESNLGMSLVVEKGVSISYMFNGILKKVGGWKFPVYDLGGENWLGIETIHHTIEVFEGYIPMTELAKNVLSKFGGKIEKITETCFKGAKNTDVYALFSEVLLRNYLMGEPAAKSIVDKGFAEVYRGIAQVDKILKKKVKIAINGSLLSIYKPYFSQERLVSPSSDQDKVLLLADISDELLVFCGLDAD